MQRSSPPLSPLCYFLMQFPFSSKEAQEFKNCWHTVCGLMYGKHVITSVDVCSWHRAAFPPTSAAPCQSPRQVCPFRKDGTQGPSSSISFAYAMAKTSITSYALMPFELWSPDQRFPLTSKCIYAAPFRYLKGTLNSTFHVLLESNLTVFPPRPWSFCQSFLGQWMAGAHPVPSLPRMLGMGCSLFPINICYTDVYIHEHTCAYAQSGRYVEMNPIQSLAKFQS